MKLLSTCLCLLAFIFTASAQKKDLLAISNGDSEIRILPILHATMAIFYEEKVIYTDPYGGKEGFANVPPPDLIVITDIHGDHMDLRTLKELAVTNIPIISPQSVADQISSEFKSVSILSNGESTRRAGVSVEAIPMYNLPEKSNSRHPKGRGNGYILTLGDIRLYVSGDTGDIEEMRALKDIDVAFVCMNLPYTMTVKAAASAVLDFKPKVVYPFHYRGSNGFSDVKKFKTLVNDQNPKIEVRLVDWYNQ